MIFPLVLELRFVKNNQRPFFKGIIICHEKIAYPGVDPVRRKRLINIKTVDRFVIYFGFYSHRYFFFQTMSSQCFPEEIKAESRIKQPHADNQPNSSFALL